MFKTYYPVQVKLMTTDRRYNKGYRIDTTSVLAHYKDRWNNSGIACIAATSGNIVELV